MKTYLIEPGDHEKEVATLFTLAELKTLHNLLKRAVAERDRAGEKIDRYTQLAAKLDYLITD
jgi:hypothetical protein